MSYKEVGWKDYPQTDTPISAANLKHMDEGIKDASDKLGDESIAEVAETVTEAINVLNSKERIKLVNSNETIRFGYDADGNYGYIKDGADTVTPFKSGFSIPLVKLVMNATGTAGRGEAGGLQSGSSASVSAKSESSLRLNTNNCKVLSIESSTHDLSYVITKTDDSEATGTIPKEGGEVDLKNAKSIEITASTGDKTSSKSTSISVWAISTSVTETVTITNITVD